MEKGTTEITHSRIFARLCVDDILYGLLLQKIRCTEISNKNRDDVPIKKSKNPLRNFQNFFLLVL